MTRLPLLSGAQVATALRRAGFKKVSQKGSHAKYRNAAGVNAIVPMHDELARPTLASILRQAGLTAEEFRKLL